MEATAEITVARVLIKSLTNS